MPLPESVTSGAGKSAQPRRGGWLSYIKLMREGSERKFGLSCIITGLALHKQHHHAVRRANPL
jgi:hypothetical protein